MGVKALLPWGQKQFGLKISRRDRSAHQRGKGGHEERSERSGSPSIPGGLEKSDKDGQGLPRIRKTQGTGKV